MLQEAPNLHVARQLLILKHEPRPPPNLSALPHGVEAEDSGRAPRGPHKARQYVDSCSLPSTVRPYEPRYAPWSLHAQAPQRRDLPEEFDEALSLDGEHQCIRLPHAISVYSRMMLKLATCMNS